MITQTHSVPTKQQFKIAIIHIFNSAPSNWRNCSTVIRLIYWNSMRKWRIEAGLKLALQKKWLIWLFLNSRLRNLTEIEWDNVKLRLHSMLSIFSQWDIYKKAISFTALPAISINYFLEMRVLLEKLNRNGIPMQKVNTILKLLILPRLLPKELTKRLRIPTKFLKFCLILHQIALFNVFKANTNCHFTQFSNKSCWTHWVVDSLWNPLRDISFLSILNYPQIFSVIFTARLTHKLKEASTSVNSSISIWRIPAIQKWCKFIIIKCSSYRQVSLQSGFGFIEILVYVWSQCWCRSI